MKNKKIKTNGLLFMVMDVYHFKLINDRYGHLNGDRALSATASTIMSIAGKNWKVCHWGGEEFAIMLLDDISDDDAVILCETACKTIYNTKITLDENTVRLTVSIGAVNSQKFVPSSLDMMVHIADRALYEAKAQGRNRVVFRSFDGNSCIYITVLI